LGTTWVLNMMRMPDVPEVSMITVVEFRAKQFIWSRVIPINEIYDDYLFIKIDLD
jgi:hypothetical protein